MDNVVRPRRTPTNTAEADPAAWMPPADPHPRRNHVNASGRRVGRFGRGWRGTPRRSIVFRLEQQWHGLGIGGPTTARPVVRNAVRRVHQPGPAFGASAAGAVEAARGRDRRRGPGGRRTARQRRRARPDTVPGRGRAAGTRAVSRGGGWSRRTGTRGTGLRVPGISQRTARGECGGVALGLAAASDGQDGVGRGPHLKRRRVAGLGGEDRRAARTPPCWIDTLTFGTAWSMPRRALGNTPGPDTLTEG